jgi:transcriptional regulator with XRE-family HTH domain
MHEDIKHKSIIIGRQLSDKREQLGLSIIECTKRMGLTCTQTIYDMESGDTNYRHRSIAKYCEVLGITNIKLK